MELFTMFGDYSKRLILFKSSLEKKSIKVCIVEEQEIKI